MKKSKQASEWATWAFWNDADTGTYREYLLEWVVSCLSCEISVHHLLNVLRKTRDDKPEQKEDVQRVIDELENDAEYTLLVSNVGWVVSASDPRRFSYNTVKALFDEYVASGTYEQVSLWSTQQDDPIQLHDTTGEETESDTSEKNG